MIGASALVDRGQHGVDDDAGDGDVEPDGKGPAGEASMGGEAAGEREEEGDEDHRKGDDGEEDVGGEQHPGRKRPPWAEAVGSGCRRGGVKLTM